MMKKLLIAVGITAAAATAAWLAVARVVPALLGRGSGDGATAARVLERAAWEPYGYQLREGPRSRSYNLPLVVKVAAQAKPNVRLILDLQDRSNYYFVELTEGHTRIGRVESGLEGDLGTRSVQGLVPGANRVILKRRHDIIEVVLNDAVVARADDESFHGGSIGAGVVGDSATLEVRPPQPCDPIYFADDFMKTASEGAAWKPVSGSWEVATLRNPSLSSNAFHYIGGAPGGKPPGIAVRGEWFWDNYRFRAAIASQGAADVGVCFYYRDPDNYYLFRWNGATQPDGAKVRKQLIKRWHGKETLLAEVPGGYQPGIWYELEVEVVEDRIRALIDGQAIFGASDPCLCFGQIGLYSAVPPPGEAHFDDILVQSARGFDEDFSTVAAGRWRPLGGSWEQTVEKDRPACRVSADAPAKAIAGSSRWRDYTLAARIRLPEQTVPATEVGLVSHYLDETNYALFAWRPAAGAARLEILVEGKRTVQEHAIVHRAPPGTRHLLAVEWKGGVATASLDGQPVASAWAPGLPRGAVGLYAAEAQALSFEHARVDFPLPPEPVLTTHEIFSRELTMEVWAGAANDWEAATETLDGASTQLFWHRADFQGDASMQIEVKEVELKADEARNVPPARLRRSCRMVLSAESGKGALSGYNFLLDWPDAATGGTACKATITRQGTRAAERRVAFSSPVYRLRFERLGNHIIASVNDEPILAAKDPHPLPGCRAAFAALNFPIRSHKAPASPGGVRVHTFGRQDVAVFSDTLRVYTFSKAASDWRPAAGTWEISNRWECDPRWSFFSGVPDASSLAAIWNKYAFDGDVSVEFAVGPKMETARGGTAYRYTRDFNVTLCADGKDLTSGYSFLYGGWDNKETAITRGNSVVARCAAVIPRASGIHRRWFYLKAEKLGSTLNFYVDGSRVLTYTDPNPLPGNRMAIWTWGNGIMVSRVRISASAIKAAEPPGTPRGPCRSLYRQ